MTITSAFKLTQDVEPADYYPFRTGRYEVAAGLRALGQDFDNGPQDRYVFQIDREWPHYRQEKLTARRESLSKYVCQSGFNAQLKTHVTSWLAEQLHREHPSLFSLSEDNSQQKTLHCRLSGETLCFTNDGELAKVDLVNSANAVIPPYADSFDALATQIQEDVAVIHAPPDEQEKLVALHLCFPNHWAAQEKIGKPFLHVHHPVADFERIARSAPGLLKNLVHGGPFVRFAWGLATDKRLNHHPTQPDNGTQSTHWHGRRFDPGNPQLYVRVERQTITGLPAAHAFVFTIRTYFLDIDTLQHEDLNALHAAIASMSQAVLEYKGIASYRIDVLQWLQRLMSA